MTHWTNYSQYYSHWTNTTIVYETIHFRWHIRKPSPDDVVNFITNPTIMKHKELYCDELGVWLTLTCIHLHAINFFCNFSNAHHYNHRRTILPNIQYTSLFAWTLSHRKKTKPYTQFHEYKYMHSSSSRAKGLLPTKYQSALMIHWARARSHIARVKQPPRTLDFVFRRQSVYSAPVSLAPKALRVSRFARIGPTASGRASERERERP